MRPRDENKVHVIHQKTVELAARAGFDGLSMHKLARAAGVSVATLYIYFKDREDLILQVAIGSMERMVTATLVDFDPTMAFAEGLHVQWHNRARYFLAHPDEMQFLEMIRYSRFEAPVADHLKNTFGHHMRTFVLGAIERGELVQLPLEVYWSIAFAPLYQLVKFHLNGHGLTGRPFKLTPAHLTQSVQLILRALTPPPDAPRSSRSP